MAGLVGTQYPQNIQSWSQLMTVMRNVYDNIIELHNQSPAAQAKPAVSKAPTAYMPSILRVYVSTQLDLKNTTILADASGGDLTLTLPLASQAKNMVYQIKKIDATFNVVTIDGHGFNIDGGSSQILGQPYDSMRMITDGKGWFVV